MFRSRAHDVQNMYVSLKQWRILHAVIDFGGFAEAAKHLHLSQSAISYTIAKLQEQLDVQLLKIEGRKAHLTAAGRALLDRSRHVLKEAIELEQMAKQLGQGWGAEVRLAVDQNFPTPLLLRGLQQFATLGCGTYVRVSETTMPRIEDVLRDRSVDLAICSRVPLGFVGEPLVEVEHIAVAHPDHPLAKLCRDATLADLERHIQIGSGLVNELESGSASSAGRIRQWHISDSNTVLEAVSGCLGYAWLPKHRVLDRLQQGTLVQLAINETYSYKTQMYLVHGHPVSAASPAGRVAGIMRGLIGETLAQTEDSDAAR
jgi:DNA-binding transcriptional LysR family regulator